MGRIYALAERRDVLGAVACVLLGWFGMRGERMPVLGHVDLGFHELGHFLCYPLPVGELVTAAAGSIAQVVVPLGLAAYFVMMRGDRVGGAICLAWAGTSALDVSRYIADAPYERLELLGGDHDWAFFFSAEGIDAMHRAAGIAQNVAGLAWLVFLASFAVLFWPKAPAAARWTSPQGVRGVG